MKQAKIYTALKLQTNKTEIESTFKKHENQAVNLVEYNDKLLWNLQRISISFQIIVKILLIN